jgi:RimJ/RimL family protein N-acetyltransferase
MQQTRISKIRLRDVTHDDLSRIYELQLDLESNRLAVTIPRSAVAFDGLWSKVLQDPNITAKAILVDEVLVGHISCFKMDGLDSVGYWIDKAFWGKGIATQALQLLLKEATARPLYAQVATSNVASLRVLQKCGFVVEQVHVAPASDRFPECEVAVLLLAK